MTKHAAFIENAKLTPATFWRIPNDVLRDRRLNAANAAERIDILKAWKARQSPASDELSLGQVTAALKEAEIGFVGGRDGAR